MQELYMIVGLSTFNQHSATIINVGKAWNTIEECRDYFKELKTDYTRQKGYTLKKESPDYKCFEYIECDEYESYNHYRVGVKTIVFTIEKIILENEKSNKK